MSFYYKPEGTSDEMLVKQIDALNKKLVDAEACVFVQEQASSGWGKEAYEQERKRTG